jgi:DNA-directed RNA polymerase specialized sigma24 family protein
MINSTIADDRLRREAAATEAFLEAPNEEAFIELFLTLTPQLVSFFRSRGCARDLSEDLSQDVMLTVYRKAAQLRDRERFRARVFTIARHALYRHQGRRSLEVVAIDVKDIVDTRTKSTGPSAFEFHHWITFL